MVKRMHSIDYGTIIKNLRIKKGLTQSELGKMICVGKATISAYERGKIMPPTFIFFSICEICGAKVIFKIYGKDYTLKELTREY